MATLLKLGEHYELNCRLAVERRASTQRAPHSSSSEVEHTQTRALPEGHVPLVAKSRLHFLKSLLSIWQSSQIPLLVSHPQLLDRAPLTSGKAVVSPSLGIQFDSSKQVLKFAAFSPLVRVLTSGSTGQPQIYEKTAFQLFDEASMLAKLLGLTQEDTLLSTTASHHIYGLLFGLFAPWASDASIVIDPDNEPSRFHPHRIAELARSLSATRLITVPAHLRALLEAKPDLGNITQVICSAAPLNPKDALNFETLYGIEVLDILGSTETGGMAVRRPARSPSYHPLPGVLVSTDRTNSLLLRSAYLPDPNQQVTTGELVTINSDGSFEYLGRSDSVVKVGGKRIDLGEIESLVMTMPGARAAHCTSQRTESLRGQNIVLVVESDSLNSMQVRLMLRSALDPTCMPRQIRIVDKLPIDERGKLTHSSVVRLFSKQAADAQLAETQDHDKQVSHFQDIASDSRRFMGHFPGSPLLPALAQLTDLILPEVRKRYGGGALVGLNRVKWSKPIAPGTRVSVQTRRLEKPQGWIHFEVRIPNATACVGSLRLEASTRATENPATDQERKE